MKSSFSEKMSFRDAAANLTQAIKLNDIETIRSLLAENPDVIHCGKVSDLPKDWISPLWEAMLRGNEKIVDLLIDFGADVNEKYSSEENESFYGLTFLHCVPHLGDYKMGIKVAEILIRRGADVNALCNSNKNTPLGNAIYASNVEYAEFLLENKATLRIGKEEDQILLIFAVAYAS